MPFLLSDCNLHSVHLWWLMALIHTVLICLQCWKCFAYIILSSLQQPCKEGQYYHPYIANGCWDWQKVSSWWIWDSNQRWSKSKNSQLTRLLAVRPTPALKECVPPVGISFFFSLSLFSECHCPNSILSYCCLYSFICNYSYFMFIAAIHIHYYCGF